MSYPPPQGQPPVDPFAGLPAESPPPPASSPRSRLPWIITAAIGVVAVAALVFAFVTMGSSNVTGAAETAKKAAEDAKDKKEKEPAYRIDEGLCADIDLGPLDGKVKLEKDALDERVHELNALACSGYGKDYKDGSVGIIVGTHSDTSEAEKAYERRKGEVFVTGTLSDLDTDWDQAEFNASTIGSPGLLVQHGNLELAIDIGLSEKNEDLANDKAKKLLKELAGNILKAVETA